MNILICNYEYPPLGGGGGVMSAQVAQDLAQRHRVTVLTSGGLGLPPERVEQGVRVIRVPVFFRRGEATANLHSMLAFIPMGIAVGKKLIREKSFDVINTHFVLPTGPVGDYLSAQAGIPNVLTLHGGDLYDPSKITSPHRHPPLRAWIRHLLRRADLVVGQSTNTLANMRRFYAPEIQGIKIPLGIQRPYFGHANPKEARADVRLAYGFSQSDILLITVGRLIPRKAVHQLLEMLDGLKNESVHLLIVGIGPSEQMLIQETQARRLENQVHFMGFVEEAEKYRLLQASDIYVSASQHEGFCLSFLEAMACGLPVLSYDYGGHTDYLKDNETGFLIPLNDLKLFTGRCRQLIENKLLRKKMGAYNRQVVEDFYIDSCASRYECEFNKAIEMKLQKSEVALFQSSRASLD